MNADLLTERFHHVLSSVLGIEAKALPANASPDTVEAWDSLKNMYIIQALEEEFGVVFSDIEIFELADVSALLDAVAKKTGTVFLEHPLAMSAAAAA